MKDESLARLHERTLSEKTNRSQNHNKTANWQIIMGTFIFLTMSLWKNR